LGQGIVRTFPTNLGGQFQRLLLLACEREIARCKEFDVVALRDRQRGIGGFDGLF